MIIGVDTGGTFTDFVYKKDGYWGIYKSPSTPVNPSVAVLNGLSRISWDTRIVNRQIVHGSTVATNAILERKGAKTAIITNKGFEDVIEIGRQNRGRIYDLSFRRPSQIVPPELRFGVRGRVLSNGEEKEPLDIASLEDIVSVLKGHNVESVAVCLLFSFVNPSHEQKAGAILEEAGIPFFLSHEIVAEFREFERTSTTVINAYVSPKMQGYIGSLISGLNQSDALGIMQSNGGRITAETAMRESVRTILSGPAGGAVGAFEAGKAAGYDKLISFDMGGTSSDVCLIDGALPLTTESGMAGYPVKVPMIDIHTVGAGGGSIAYLDQGGSLRVGPQSAGADPGPICYGKGEWITVTDANLLLGRLITDGFLAGQMRLDKKRLHFYFESVAAQAGISIQELAEGILDVVNSAMERAIRVISVERGHDPAEFTLLAFGGAGAMHDGENAIHSHMTNTLNTPVEALEYSCPFLVTEYSIRRGSGGKGLHCGGDGITRQVELLTDADVTVLSERRNFPPYGLFGGMPGRSGRNMVISNGEEREMPGKFSVKLKKATPSGLKPPVAVVMDNSQKSRVEAGRQGGLFPVCIFESHSERNGGFIRNSSSVDSMRCRPCKDGPLRL